MRGVAVIGAGVVGVTTAWYLREHGFEVTVYDRLGGPALATSAANAGVIAPGYVTPWAAPGMPGKLARSLGQAASPLVFRPSLNPAQWRWIGRWLRECDPQRYRRNRERMQRLARYSRDQLHLLRRSTGLEDDSSRGYLQLFRSEQDVELNAPARRMLDEQGIPYRLLGAAEARALEPSLRADTPLAGALHLPDDESANCQLFTTRLAALCERRGVRFEFGREVAGVRHAHGRATGLLLVRHRIAEPNTVPFDAVVIASGVHSVPLLARLGIAVPIYPVKGFSATIDLRPGVAGPAQALMDEAYKTAITPLGRQLRIAGTAEMSGHGMRLRAGALRTLRKVAQDWFGDRFDLATARYWVGARPMTPDGPPLLGRTRLAGLYVNIGHGSTGWAMSCGSARLVSDLLAGESPGIDLDGLTLARLAV
ncbi:MAG: D-amino acid dehydrogenase [Burkholderiaceae bacterium]|nr:D-amino acid dehydrogenase [Burkholderiaceae bacterium]